MRPATIVGWALWVGACNGSDRPGGYVPPDAGDSGVDAAAPDSAANSPGCEGQTPYRPAPDGGREFLPACLSPRPFCSSSLGCLACPPASTRCDSARPEVPQRCADDGSAWVDHPACEGSEHQHCADGVCGDPCALAAAARQSLGCDYWATATPNSQLPPSFPFAVAVANPHAYAVTVQISGGALPAPRTEVFQAGEARAIELPWVDELVQFSHDNSGCTCRDASVSDCANPQPAHSTLVRGGAYRVHATAPVAAYQFNSLTYERHAATGACFDSYTNGASLLLSAAALTRHYDLLTVARNARFPGFVAVVGVSDEPTSVTVRLPRDHGVGEAVGGTVRQTGLRAGDVMVVAQSDDGDLSGASIEATQPVAVFGGHDCAFVPFPRPACDHMEEQLLPRETLGREYVVANLRDRPLGARVRLTAPFGDTRVEFDPPRAGAPQTLRVGQVLEVPQLESFRVRASRPVLVMQFMYGAGDGGPPGDPEVVQEVPVEQYRARYDLFVPDTYLTSYFEVVAPHGTNVLLDEVALGGDVEPVGPWDVTLARETAGRHLLRTAEGVPLGVKVYGTGTATSYMYPGGLDLQLITPQ